MRAMTTLMENDLPVSLVMKAIDGPLIVPRKSPGPYGVEVSIERVTWNGSGQSALLADPCDVRIGSHRDHVETAAYCAVAVVALSIRGREVDCDADRHQLLNNFRLPRDTHGFLQQVKASPGFLADGNVDEVSSVLAWLPGARHACSPDRARHHRQAARPNESGKSPKVTDGAD
jgi:hypothetical protein